MDIMSDEQSPDAETENESKNPTGKIIYLVFNLETNMCMAVALGLDPILSSHIRVGGKRMLENITKRMENGKKYTNVTIISLDPDYDTKNSIKFRTWYNGDVKFHLDPEKLASACVSILDSSLCIILGDVLTYVD